MKRTNLKIGMLIVLVIVFIFFFHITKENRTLIQMNKAYKLSDTFKQESLVDRSKFVTERDGEVTIVVLGSSVTYGKGATEAQPSWGNLLGAELDKMAGINAKVINHGYSGYSTANLISENKISSVIKDDPDIIIFELCLINNNRYPQSGIDQTKADIDWIMDMLNEELPDTLVIVQTANPTIYNDVFLTGNQFTYDEYNNEISEYVKEQQWPFIDIYHLMQTKIEERNLSIGDVLADDVHPNGEGYSIWFELLKERFDVPVKELH
ncbi:SGNH/GDSL hydrolase family protein [Carnobacterium sp. ISL-102]|uniref:SGNH/GDSL hydrolase family protein n=1 Tax=Carnobacterium sp. ISL-102 TaxID=2819142 RepID=UPI001BE66568|nr:SGNH/GDSL hydrolase family protein [Carnobacterium sp. ISL-102]MBT2731056.1 SGNH/GDSL hydrolase family protein [Carnobacterium sp. ISL-102]